MLFKRTQEDQGPPRDDFVPQLRFTTLETPIKWPLRLREAFGLAAKASIRELLSGFSATDCRLFEASHAALGSIGSATLLFQHEKAGWYIAYLQDGHDGESLLTLLPAPALGEWHERQRQEAEQVKAETRQLSTILNMLPLPVWQRDADRNLRFTNVAYMDAADQSSGLEGQEINPEAPGMAETAQRLGEAVTARRHMVINGDRLLYQFNEVPAGDRTLVGYAKDITEIEEAEEELRRHINAQRDLLESTTSAIAVYGPDQALKFYNKAFVNLWKLDEEWLARCPSYGEVLEQLREDRKLPEQANFRSFKQEHLKLFTMVITKHEDYFYLPDGRTVRLLVLPHALGGLLFVYEDVTDRLALERSYNTLIAVQRATLDHLHEGVAVFSEEGALQLYNPEYLSLWRLDEAVAQTQPHITSVLEHCRQHFDEMAEGFREELLIAIQERAHKQLRIQRSDGILLSISTVPLPDGATLVTCDDITDTMLVERSLREKNEALEEADRLKTEFLANVSYELRSPLTSITGFAELLKSGYAGKLNDQQVDYIESIYQASGQLQQLIDNILDIATIEAGFMQLDVAEFDIRQLAEGLLSLVQERARERGVRVSLECANIGSMTGDANRLKQAFFNLLSNALRHSVDGQQVTFSVTAEGNWVQFSIGDQGPGIPETEQEAMFDRFTKGGRGAGGAGLGLAMVKSFVEMHGGHVALQSAVGHGTLVICELPRKYSADRTASV